MPILIRTPVKLPDHGRRPARRGQSGRCCPRLKWFYQAEYVVFPWALFEMSKIVPSFHRATEQASVAVSIARIRISRRALAMVSHKMARILTHPGRITPPSGSPEADRAFNIPRARRGRQAGEEGRAVGTHHRAVVADHQHPAIGDVADQSPYPCLSVMTASGSWTSSNGSPRADGSPPCALSEADRPAM